MAKGTLLLTVEDAFLISGRGLVITPHLMDSLLHGKVNLRLVRPDGTTLECAGFLGPTISVPSSPLGKIALTLYGVEKDDVPQGTNVYSM